MKRGHHFAIFELLKRQPHIIHLTRFTYLNDGLTDIHLQLKSLR